MDINKTKKEGLSWIEFDTTCAHLLKYYFLIDKGKKTLKLAKKLYNQNYSPREASGLILLNN